MLRHAGLSPRGSAALLLRDFSGFSGVGEFAMAGAGKWVVVICCLGSSRRRGRSPAVFRGFASSMFMRDLRAVLFLCLEAAAFARGRGFLLAISATGCVGVHAAYFSGPRGSSLSWAPEWCPCPLLLVIPAVALAVEAAVGAEVQEDVVCPGLQNVDEEL